MGGLHVRWFESKSASLAHFSNTSQLRVWIKVLQGCNRKSEREFYLFTISIFDIKGCSLLNMNRTQLSLSFFFLVFSAFRASYIPAFLSFVLCSSGFHFPIYVFLPVFLFLSVSPFLCLSVCLSVCLSLSVSLCLCLSLCVLLLFILFLFEFFVWTVCRHTVRLSNCWLPCCIVNCLWLISLPACLFVFRSVFTTDLSHSVSSTTDTIQ